MFYFNIYLLVIYLNLLIPLAIALSLDAFSVAIAIGIYNAEKKHHMIFSLIVGVFHFFMPVLGSITNNLLFGKFIINGNKFMGTILLIIAIQGILELKKEDNSFVNNNVFLLAFAVSIDSYFAGVGLQSIRSVKKAHYLIFTIFSSIFSFIGCKIGHKAKKVFNNLANYIAILILIILGVKYILM